MQSQRWILHVRRTHQHTKTSKLEYAFDAIDNDDSFQNVSSKHALIFIQVQLAVENKLIQHSICS